MKKRYFIATYLALVANAYTGTPCPDPKTYRIIQGECKLAMCGGYLPYGGVSESGECVRPGNSAFVCKETKVIANMKVPQMSGPYENWCGYGAYLQCSLIERSLFGIVEAKSTSTPCPYNCVNPVP